MAGCFSRVSLKLFLGYTRRITPKRVTSYGAHLRGLAPGQHSSEETSQRWRVVGDIVSGLIGLGIESRTSRTDKALSSITELTGQFYKQVVNEISARKSRVEVQCAAASSHHLRVPRSFSLIAFLSGRFEEVTSRWTFLIFVGFCPPELCQVAPDKRIQCDGVDRDSCFSTGCCYNEATKPRCYRSVRGESRLVGGRLNGEETQTKGWNSFRKRGVGLQSSFT